MNIQRRNVSSERILILFSNTTDLFFREKLIFHQKAEKMQFFFDIISVILTRNSLSLCGITSSNPFPSVPKLYTAIASSSIYRMTVLPENLVNGGVNVLNSLNKKP
jgi:hypothetical protein